MFPGFAPLSGCEEFFIDIELSGYNSFAERSYVKEKYLGGFLSQRKSLLKYLHVIVISQFIIYEVYAFAIYAKICGLFPEVLETVYLLQNTHTGNPVPSVFHR